MTSQIQAEKLVSDFYIINSKLIIPKNMNDLSNRYNLVMPIAKECALICVENYINYYFYTSTVLYWQEVKQEIEKL